MSFIGADGQDHLIRSLKAQVQSKDGELASVRNELAKCKQSLDEEKKARQGLEYQVSIDAQGAETNGKNTVGMKQEIAQLKQNLFNRETSLQTANHTIKRLEKEKAGLEYELETAGSSNGDAARLQLERNTKLQNEVKALKQELQRKDAEEARSKAASAKVQAESGIPVSRIPGIKRPTPTSNIFGSSTPSSEAGPSRRCSTSLSTTREAELTKEIGLLKTQMSGLRIKADKAANEKLAAEKHAEKREVELNDRLTDLADELDFYRSNAEKSGADPKKVKQMEEGLGKLRKENEELATAAEAAKTEAVRLEEQMKRVHDLEEELEHVKQALASASSAPADKGAIQALQEEVDSLKAKLGEQEIALANASSSPSTAVAPESDRVLDLTKQVRQLKRDNDMAKHLVKTAEQERDDLESENAELSRKLVSFRGDKPLMDGKEVDVLRKALGDAQGLVRQYEQDVARLEGAAAAGEAKRAEMSGELQNAKAELADAQKQAAESQSALKQLEVNQDALRSEVSSAKRRAEDAEAAVVYAQKEVQTALSNAEVDRSAVEAAKSAQTDADRRLEELQIELGDLTSKLAAERASAKDTKEHLQGLQIKLDSSLAALAEAEAMTFGVKEERDQARAMRDQLEAKVRAVQAALDEADVAKEAAFDDMQHLEATLQATHTELEAAQSALKQQTLEVERLSYQLQSSAADNARLEQKLSEAEDTLANRSTETEAQHRQEEVFQLKDDLEAAHREKRKMQATERERLDDIEAKRAEIDAMQQKVEQLEERVADLVSQLAEARATPPIEVNIAPQPVVATDSSHVQLLHATIDRLRAERDELRQTMSFVKHEHRFALQASEDDKATTLEKLQMAQRDAKIKDAEVSKKLAELEVLQKQITTTAVELDNLRSRLARQANTEQQSAELASKIEILESDLQEVHRERTDLKAEVEQLGRVRDAAVSDLDAFRYQSTEALKREAKLQQDINRLRSERDEARDTVIAPASATPSMRSPVESIFTRPASAAGSYDLERRRSGHMRRQSMQDLGASQTIDITAQVKALQVSLKSEEDKVNSLEVKLRTEITRKEAEQERVKRREQTIAQLREEKRIAEERIIVSDDIGDVTVDEADIAQIALLQSQLDQVKASSASSLAEFEAKAAVINSELQQAISQRDELSARLLEMQSESATKLAESDSERMALAAQLRDVNSAKDELAVQLDEIRASYADNVSAREKLDMRIGDLEAELASAREKSTTATAERDALQSQLSADQDSIRVEMEELFTAKHALEKKVYKLEASERALQGEVETLTTEAACTAEAHAAVITAKGAEKQAADEELALVQGELATVRTTTAELQSSMTAKTAELHRLNELVDDLTGEIALRDADEMKVHHDMALLSQHIAAAERDKEAAEKANAEVLAKMAELQYAQDEAASIAVAKDELQATVEQKETELVALRKHKEAGVAVSAEKDQLSTKIAELETRIESLRAEAAEAATLRAEKQELDARAAEMETRILEMTDATDKLRAELEEARSTAALVATDAQGQVAEATQFAADLKQQLIASEDAKTALQAAVHNAEKRIFYLEERIAKLDSTEAELRAELAAVKEERDDGVSRITEISASLAAAEEKAGGQLLSIERLTAKLEAAETRAVALSADSESMIKLEEEKTRLREQLEDAQSKLEEGKANVAELSDELAAGRANVADAERAAQTAAQGLLDLKSRLAEAELEAEKRVPMDEMNRITADLAAMKRELGIARQSAQEAERLVMSKDSIVAELRRANEEYSRKLSAMTAKSLAAVDQEEVSRLKEQIEHLEATLEQRNAECEQYDDKLNEASQAMKLLKRKHDKMVRDIKKKEKDDELARITALNVKLSKPTAEEAGTAPAPRPAASAMRAAPASVPSRPTPSAFAPAPTPSSAPTASLAPPVSLKTTASPNIAPRQPLLRVFDESQIPASFATAISPLAGTKRGRETDDTAKPLKAEAIMLPPSGLAPTGPFKMPVTQNKANIFGDGGKENARRLAEMPVGGAGVRRTTVPARNVFSPEP